MNSAIKAKISISKPELLTSEQVLPLENSKYLFISWYIYLAKGMLTYGECKYVGIFSERD